MVFTQVRIDCVKFAPQGANKITEIDSLSGIRGLAILHSLYSGEMTGVMWCVADSCPVGSYWI